MNIANAVTTVSNREFVAMIRKRLDADGYRDVAVQRSWIDTDAPEHPFLMNVPIGTDLVVPLLPLSGFVIDRDDESVADAVRHFSTALVNLKLATRTLTKYVEDVRRAARREIAAARASGLDMTLESVGFEPVLAWHLSDSSWKEAATYLLASLRIGRTGFHLRPETSLIKVGAERRRGGHRRPSEGPAQAAGAARCHGGARCRPRGRRAHAGAAPGAPTGCRATAP